MIVRRLIFAAVVLALVALAWRRSHEQPGRITDDERELARRGWLDTTRRP